MGTIRAALERDGIWNGSAFVMLSDHELRRRTTPANYPHIPLIVKAPDQMTRIDVADPVKAEIVVADVVRSFSARPRADRSGTPY